MSEKHSLDHQLVNELLKEKRRERFWKNVRFFAGFILFAIVISVAMGQKENGDMVNLGKKGGAYVALVHLDGMIAPGQPFSAEQVIPVLRDAFADKEAKGVILDINSGGGTPVQASIIHDEVLKFKKRYKKQVVVVGEDLLASGAYFVAASADKIYVNPNTITGSIGVIMEGFGLADAIKKIGVDRRVITAGANKDRLDMFMPQTPADKAKIQTVLDEVHNSFNQAVLEGRKGKLHGNPAELFSGDFWTGQTALKLGLVDAVGNLSDAMQNEFHVSSYKDYSQPENPFKSLLGHLGAVLNLPLNSTSFALQEKL